MPIRFRCKCGKVLKVEERYAGQKATCPNCGAQLVVPSAAAPAASDAERLAGAGRASA